MFFLQNGTCLDFSCFENKHRSTYQRFIRCRCLQGHSCYHIIDVYRCFLLVPSIFQQHCLFAFRLLGKPRLFTAQAEETIAGFLPTWGCLSRAGAILMVWMVRYLVFNGVQIFWSIVFPWFVRFFFNVYICFVSFVLSFSLDLL